MDFLLEPQTRTKTGRKKAKHTFVVHAEANAMILAGQADLEGSIAFVTIFPCLECAKMLIAVSDIENIHTTYYSETCVKQGP